MTSLGSLPRIRIISNQTPGPAPEECARSGETVPGPAGRLASSTRDRHRTLDHGRSRVFLDGESFGTTRGRAVSPAQPRPRRFDLPQSALKHVRTEGEGGEIPAFSSGRAPPTSGDVRRRSSGNAVVELSHQFRVWLESLARSTPDSPACSAGRPRDLGTSLSPPCQVSRAGSGGWRGGPGRRPLGSPRSG